MKIHEVQPFVNSIYIAEDMGVDSSAVQSSIDTMFSDMSLWETGHTFRMQSKVLQDSSKFKMLFDVIDPIAKQTIESWGVTKPIRLKDYWINIDGSTSSGTSHCHANALLSGCFYLTMPKGSGAIVIERPDPQEYVFKADVLNQYSYQIYTIVPKENSMVFFPSFMKHRVTKSFFENQLDKRISIAFDYGYA